MISATTRYVSSIAAIALVSGCQSFNQTSEEAYFREPGEALLGHPTPVGKQAARDVTFAFLSEQVYRNTEEGRADEVEAKAEQQPLVNLTSCPDSHDALLALGWKPWPGFPSTSMAKKFAETGLRAEVWMNLNALKPMVVVTFGGTEGLSGKDWRSNLRWFFKMRDDQYDQVQKYFAVKFVKEYEKRLQEPAWAPLKNAAIFSTGHSLGGGLAQSFAYSLPPSQAVPRVTEVFVFNTTPVTAYTNVPADIRSTNTKGLVINRIYERGEILASARSMATLFYKPTTERPAMRAIRYSLFYKSPLGLISSHKIKPLACGLYSKTNPAEIKTALEDAANGSGKFSKD